VYLDFSSFSVLTIWLFFVWHFFLFVSGSLATLILPAAIYLKVMPPDSEMIFHARCLLVMGISVMIAVVVVTILGMF
jgi:hypothetical protein